MLKRLQEAGLPVKVGRATREQSAMLYAQSRLAFNASLNGDLNMRVFETLSASGCLLTDRLSPVSGLSGVLEEGSEFLGYGSGDELVEQAQSLMGDPARAAAMAAAGYRRYMAELAPELQKKRLLDWVGGADISPLHLGLDDPRVRRAGRPERLAARLRAYERVQELHRTQENPVANIAATHPADLVLDLADLPRLTLRLESDMPDVAALAEQARALGATVVITGQGS